MSRVIEIISGDFGHQKGELVQLGIQQKPAITFRAYTETKGLFGMKKRWEKVTWLVAEHVKHVEKIREMEDDSDEAEWNLPGVKRKSKRKSGPPKIGEKISRGVKKVQFRVTFNDGRNFSANADSRVFQNLMAIAGSK